MAAESSRRGQRKAWHKKEQDQENPKRQRAEKGLREGEKNQEQQGEAKRRGLRHTCTKAHPRCYVAAPPSPPHTNFALNNKLFETVSGKKECTYCQREVGFRRNESYAEKNRSVWGSFAYPLPEAYPKLNLGKRFTEAFL